MQTEVLSEQAALEKEANEFQRQMAANIIPEEKAKVLYEQLMQKQQMLMEKKERYTQQVAEKEMNMNFRLIDSVTAYLKRYNRQYQFDYIIEQTFFCAIDTSRRSDYAKQMQKLLKPTGKLVGLLLDKHFESNPPFGGDKQEYETLFQQFFTIDKLAPCYNSIKPRQGSELFFILSQKK